MNIKQKIIALVFVMIGMFAIALPQTVSADCKEDPSKGLYCCGGAQTSLLKCTQKEGAKTAKDSGVWGLLLIVLNIMTAGVGILAVGGIVYGAILYASSSDNAEQTKKAKQVVKDVVIGIIAYAAMYLGLNFLIPGGIFS